MRLPRQFQRVKVAPQDGVTVWIYSIAGEAVAEVIWPRQGEAGQVVGQAHQVQIAMAFSHALDMKTKLSLKEIVVLIDDMRLWEKKWGTLVE
jgi:hypothetical protein